jgi:hypothetical protein
MLFLFLQASYIPSVILPMRSRFITIFSPGGFEGFFREMGISADSSDAHASSVKQEPIQKVIVDAGLYGMDLFLKDK